MRPGAPGRAGDPCSQASCDSPESLDSAAVAIFRDESGRRGAAVRLATVAAGAAVLAALGTFLVSVFPAPWTRRGEVLPEAAPAAKAAAGGAIERRGRGGACPPAGQTRPE